MYPPTAEPPHGSRHDVSVTTADTIARLANPANGTRDLAPLGITLRHFTEPALARLDVGRVRLHRATTVLTKQVAEAIDARHPVANLRRLLGDPDRIALPSGTTASEFCGPSWEQVAATGARRLDDFAAGVDQFGVETVLRLSELHAADALSPWWGTPAWDRRVELWTDVAPEGSVFRLLLLRSPEHVDDAILSKLLR